MGENVCGTCFKKCHKLLVSPCISDILKAPTRVSVLGSLWVSFGVA